MIESGSDSELVTVAMLLSGTELTLTTGTRSAHPAGETVAVSGIRPAEITRAGAQATRSWRYGRWIDGTQLSWIGRRVSTGRGPGSSGLRFDLTLPVSRPAGAALTSEDTRNGRAVGGPTAQARSMPGDEGAIASARSTTAAKEDGMIDTGPAAVGAAEGQVDAKQNGAPPPRDKPDDTPPKGTEETQGAPQGTQPPVPPGDSGDGIAGMSVLRGLIVYTAVLAFTALYLEFIVLISRAQANHIPNIGSAKITAAAALAGVLGSAFALRVGNPSAQPLVNQQLDNHLAKGKQSGAKKRTKWASYVHRALSLEASHPNRKSWPVTAGIWLYAAVGTAVAITYALNEAETPPMVKALAVAFAGYVVAFLSVAFGVHSSASGSPTNPPPQ